MTTALFIHHSVGRQIIQERGLRQKLSDSMCSLELWDRGYNESGLSDGRGSPVGISFPIPGDNTDPLGLLTGHRSNLLDPALTEIGVGCVLQNESMLCSQVFLGP